MWTVSVSCNVHRFQFTARDERPVRSVRYGFQASYTQNRMFHIFATVFTGLAGLAFGSFLNVCLSRWPAGESIVKPRSHCRSCGRSLAWWENVPLLSWIALRGRCRRCKTRIGWRYVLVELAVGALWATVAWQTVDQFFSLAIDSDMPVSFSPLFLEQAAATFFGKLIFIWLLVGLAALDAEHLWLPDIVTLPGIFLGVGVTLLRRNPLLDLPGMASPILLQLTTLAFDLLIAAGLVLLIRWVYWLVRRREGIGLGDAKLMAMLAAWLGMAGALLSFALGMVLGALAGVAILAAPKADGADPGGLTKLPLGTFLSIGGIASVLWGAQILAIYLRWAGLSRP